VVQSSFFGFWEKADQLWSQLRPLSIKKLDQTGLSNTIKKRLLKFARRRYNEKNIVRQSSCNCGNIQESGA